MARPRKVGPYRVLEEIGRGGMARVYRAVHEDLQREVALKELPAGVDTESTSRFRREALALAAFRSEHIVTLYDLLEKNDALYLAMELVDGPTLADLLKEGPLPPPVAAVIGVRVAAALEHAHFHRILHRDVKPSNVMLTRAGGVKLMDFGIAKDEQLATLTQSGMAVGTPAYMSPEQVTGDALDARTDLYSLGVVLYECLSGEKPFSGKNAGEVFARIRDGRFTRLRKRTPQGPRPLVRAVEHAMEKAPEKRPFDASEFRRALERYTMDSVGVSHPALLMAYLRHKNHITETEALARLTRKELKLVDRFDEPARPKRWGALLGLVVLAALGAGGAWLGMHWSQVLPHAHVVVQRLSEFFK